jgi:hypothetical protein
MVNPPKFELGHLTPLNMQYRTNYPLQLLIVVLQPVLSTLTSGIGHAGMVQLNQPLIAWSDRTKRHRPARSVLQCYMHRPTAPTARALLPLRRRGFILRLHLCRSAGSSLTATRSTTMKCAGVRGRARWRRARRQVYL